MRKKFKLILSLICIFFSISLLGFGVFCAVAPSVNVGGIVSYRVHDAKVLVQGMVQNALSSNGNRVHCESLPQPNNALDLQEDDKITGQCDKYLDFTTGNDFDQNETLAQWNVGDLCFEESAAGVKEIQICVRVTNFSNYPVKASVATTGLQKDNLSTKILINNIDTKEIVLSAKSDTSKNFADIILKIGVNSNALKIDKTDFTLNINIAKNEVSGITTDDTDTKQYAPIEYLKYSYSQDLTATVIGYTGKGDVLAIPEQTYYANNNYSVTTIGDNAFEDSEITSIILPSTITKIESNAFLGREDLLQNLVLPDNMLELDGITNGYPKESCVEYLGGIYISSDTNKYFALVGSNQKIDTIHPDCKVIKDIFNLSFSDEINVPKNVQSIAAHFDCPTVIFEPQSELKIVGERSNIFEKVIQNLPQNIQSIKCSVTPQYISNGLGYIGTSENNYLYLVSTTADISEDAIVEYGCVLISAKAFVNCYEQVSLTMPSTIKVIQSLPTYTYTLKVLSTTPPQFCCIKNQDGLGEIYVPAESLNAYKQANSGATIGKTVYLSWSDFAESIFELESDEE